MPTEKIMCRTQEEIENSNFIVGEIDKHITRNHLSDLERLNLDILRHLVIRAEQNKDDISEAARLAKKAAEEVENHPSLMWYFRNKTGATLAIMFSLTMAMFFIYHVIEYLVGFQEFITGWIP